MVEIVRKSIDDNERRSSKPSEIFTTKVGATKTGTEFNKDVECGDNCKKNGVADFEEAISAAGYGKFHILLLLCTWPAFASSIYVTSSLSYIMTSAECDLNMDLVDMGQLNTIAYAGMVTSAMLWGFLSDTLGRKKIMVWGFIAVSICELFASLSQVFWMLALSKFCAGFIFNGPFGILISYISEMHTAATRAKIIVYVGVFYAIGNMNLPLLAWVIIPTHWTISLFNGAYILQTWQIFLMIFTIPPLAGGIAINLLPESPKFLMSRGRNEEALKVFRTIYAMNSGKPEDEYPIKCLMDDTVEKNGKEAPRGWEAIKGGAKQLRLLIEPHYLGYLLLICALNASAMFGSNTLRLWFPQMATIFEDYSMNHDETAPLCEMISSHVSNKTFSSLTEEELLECVKMVPGASTYINSVIIGVGSLITFLIGGFIVNALGKKKLGCLTLLISASCSFAMYWSNSMSETVALFTVFVSLSSLTGSVLSTVTVDLFPTSIRAMAVAVFLMSGRIGTITGGITFPYLLAMGCVVPFVFIGVIMMLGAGFCLALPKTTLKRLE